MIPTVDIPVTSHFSLVNDAIIIFIQFFYTLKIIAFFLLFSEEPPNLVTLLRFPTSEGYINLTKKVGDNFKTFGTLLLKDKSGAIMSGLEHTYNGRVMDITRAVFTMWITSEPTPVTWENLLTSMRSSGLETLIESELTP